MDEASQGMSGRWMTNLVLALVLGGLAAWLMLQPEEEEGAATPFLGLDRAAVERIEILRPEDEPAVLVREDGVWQMQTPYPARARADQVQRLFRLLPERSETSYPVGDVDPEESGLSTPSRILRLGGVEARFGDSTPVGRRRYMATGETVHLVSDTVYLLLAGPATDWVAKELVPDGAEIIRLEIPGLSLDRTEEGWVREPPFPEDAGPADAGGQETGPPQPVGSWSRISALRVRPLDVEIPEDAPAVTVAVAGEATPRRWWILPGGERLRLADREAGLVYELASAQRETLGLAPGPSDDEG